MKNIRQTSTLLVVFTSAVHIYHVEICSSHLSSGSRYISLVLKFLLQRNYCRPMRRGRCWVARSVFADLHRKSSRRVYVNRMPYLESLAQPDPAIGRNNNAPKNAPATTMITRLAPRVYQRQSSPQTKTFVKKFLLSNQSQLFSSTQ